MDRARLAALARTHGFATARFTRVRPTPRGDAFDRWLARGLHADLHWMARGRDVRVDVARRAPWARTAMVLAVHHHHRAPPDPGGWTGRVARYAWGRDYHNLVGKRLQKLRRALDEAGVQAWGGVDAAPILERAWAEAAGLGFSGKNTLQIVPGEGSFLFLAVLFLSVEVEPDEPIRRDHCRTCARCLTGCPTDAFVAPRTLATDRCLSYWTIEARELPPPELRPRLGRWVFGCDVCQEVCPHNHRPDDPDEDDLRPRNAWIDLEALLCATDDEVLRRYEGTPLRRPGAEGLKRNALLVLANLGDPGALPLVRRTGARHPDAVVRSAAAWAEAVLSGDAPPGGVRPSGPPLPAAPRRP
jgi:epoxyqueuosine reductase